MFKREKKVYLELTDKEYRLVRKYLMDWRNKLTAQGRDAAPVERATDKADGLKIKCSSIHTPLFVRWTQGGVNFWTRRESNEHRSGEAHGR